MLDTLAYAALLGFDVEKIMTGDSLERNVRIRAVERAVELRDRYMRAQAVEIVNALGEAMK